MRKKFITNQLLILGFVIALLAIMLSGSATMARDGNNNTINPHNVNVIRPSAVPATGVKPNSRDKTAKNQDTLHSQSVRQVPKASFLRRFGYGLLILLAIITLGALFRRWKTFI
jgi:hypothetical protein